MAKKKSGLNLGKILGLVAAVLGLVAVCMIFVDTVKVPDTEILGKVIEGEGYTGLKVAFGYKTDDVAVFSFSFMAVVPYLLMIAGVVLAVVNSMAKKSNKILDIVVCGLFVVAAVLCFVMPNFVVCADTLLGKIAAEIDYTLAIGAIVSAITSILAAAAVLVKALMKK